MPCLHYFRGLSKGLCSGRAEASSLGCRDVCCSRTRAPTRGFLSQPGLGRRVSRSQHWRGPMRLPSDCEVCRAQGELLGGSACVAPRNCRGHRFVLSHLLVAPGHLTMCGVCDRTAARKGSCEKAGKYPAKCVGYKLQRTRIRPIAVAMIYIALPTALVDNPLSSRRPLDLVDGRQARPLFLHVANGTSALLLPLKTLCHRYNESPEVRQR